MLEICNRSFKKFYKQTKFSYQKVMSIIKANKSSYYVAIYDKDYNVIFDETFMKANEVLNLCNKYNPYIVGEDISIIGNYKINKQKLDIVKIVNYYRNMDGINYHKLVPNYIKEPQALEDKK